MATTTTPGPRTAPTTEPRRSGLSVRVRITAFVSLLVVLALAGAGAVVYAISTDQVEDAVAAETEQELAEFQQFIDPVDPTEALPTSLRGKLETFIARNVPDACEVLVGWQDGRPREVLAGADIVSSREMLTDPQVLQAAREVTEGGGSSTTIRTEAYGELAIAAQTVDQGGVQGALVVITNLDLERAELQETMRTYATVAVLSWLLITGLAAWQSGRLLAPLRVLRETTEEISETDLALRLPEVGNDDITALTRTLNGMLARLEAAFGDQRQFLDDAGHELKTPLTVLQGHLELLDAGNPDEVAETRELLLDEVDRMSRLVGDLILLAKHDRPDFVTPRPVSVERLTHTLFAKLRGLAERDWELDRVGEGIAQLDEQRITQAVLQLADNAVKHTTPDDAITLSSTVVDGWVEISVADSGPGVPDALKDHVFERFGRAEVLEGDEGFGLGLSIVGAIAAAHGGRVTVADAHTHGTRPGAVFTLHIPQEHPWPAS